MIDNPFPIPASRTRQPMRMTGNSLYLLPDMNRSVSFLVSLVFHPVFVNLFSLLLLFVVFPYLQYAVSGRLQTFYILFIFITTGLIPAISVGILKPLGKIDSVLLNDQQQRTIPYIITSTIYLFDYYFLQRIGSPQLLNAYLLGSASIVVAVLIINRFNKISIHAASLGALMGVAISGLHTANFDIRVLMAILFIVTGLTASARLFANSHVPQQVYFGFLLGLAIMIFIL
jgi:hypothetical protein